MTAKRRILVVDDAEGIRSYLASLLELRGFQVDTAEDGQSALALLESGAAPDLIILDVMMPGIDGLETLRRIRARDRGGPRGDALGGGQGGHDRRGHAARRDRLPEQALRGGRAGAHHLEGVREAGSRSGVSAAPRRPRSRRRRRGERVGG